MQTHFSLAQLADPDMAESEKILRSCVHCGFCLATCPTYQVLGDELDSPRGRIYQIKAMLEDGGLERGGSAPATVAKHLDRCLSCLACMTTCPSGVHYMHLVDHGRAVVEQTYRRPWRDRALRALLATVLPRPRLFRLALMGAILGRPAAPLLSRRLRAMLALAPRRLLPPSSVDRPQVFAAEGPRRRRVALLSGCAQTVLAPGLNEATIRLLTRHGIEVVVAPGAGCCGSLTHHMGREDAARASARANIEAWSREAEANGLDAIVVNTSGCGTTVKDYGHMFRTDRVWADRAAGVSALARDVTELMDEVGLNPVVRATGQAVAYHSACSMQHGQRIAAPPRRLLAAAGFAVREVPDGHLCCGSAGTYNLLQPEIADELRARKVRAVESTGAAIVAAGNIGCMTQIGLGTALPVVHTVELLDWATGGPRPAAIIVG